MKKNYTTNYFLLVLVTLLVFSYGCSGLQVADKKPVQTVIEKNPKIQPEWTKSSTSYWVETGNHYATDFEDSSVDQQTSLIKAAEDAKLQLIQTIKKNLIAEIKEKTKTQSDLKAKEYVNNTFSSVINKTTISNIQKKEIYTEKIKEKFKKEEKIFYRSYVLLELSKSSYNKIIQQIFTNVKSEIKKSPNAKKMVETIEKTFFPKLKKG